MTFDTLRSILAPPIAPSENNGPWPAVAQKLGTDLPADFQSFIKFYGLGKVADFIVVLNPFTHYESVNFLQQAKEQTDSLHCLFKEFPNPSHPPLFPERDGLLPVAFTDNGDVIYWVTRGSPPDWTIAVNASRSLEFEYYNFDFTSFLVKLLTQEIRCPAFPKNLFLNNKIEFVSV